MDRQARKLTSGGKEGENGSENGSELGSNTDSESEEKVRYISAKSLTAACTRNLRKVDSPLSLFLRYYLLS